MNIFCVHKLKGSVRLIHYHNFCASFQTTNTDVTFFLVSLPDQMY